MSMIKGYLTMRELAENMGWHYCVALALAKELGFRKLGKSALISKAELEAIGLAFRDLHIQLSRIRESE